MASRGVWGVEQGWSVVLGEPQLVLVLILQFLGMRKCQGQSHHVVHRAQGRCITTKHQSQGRVRAV